MFFTGIHFFLTVPSLKMLNIIPFSLNKIHVPVLESAGFLLNIPL